LLRSDENDKAIQAFFNQLCSDFGHASGEAIMRLFINMLGGMRITVPTIKEINRKERDQKIRNMFHGDNHRELAKVFDLTEGQIRRIVHGKNKNKKSEDNDGL
jgi:Mor family transcriptional regulator